jgi:hypothetical protein
MNEHATVAPVMALDAVPVKKEYVECVFVVPVGGTRGVPWRTARIIQIHVRITWGVALILAMFFHLVLV